MVHGFYLPQISQIFAENNLYYSLAINLLLFSLSSIFFCLISCLLTPLYFLFSFSFPLLTYFHFVLPTSNLFQSFLYFLLSCFLSLVSCFLFLRLFSLLYYLFSLFYFLIGSLQLEFVFLQKLKHS